MPKPHQRLFFLNEQRPPESSGGRERVRVRLWLLNDAGGKAVHMLVAPESEARRVWVARSLMGERISKHRDPGCAFWCWEFTLPLWKAEELKIQYE